MKKILIFTILIIFLLLPGLIGAQESTDSATNEDVTQKIKDRLKETAETGLNSLKEDLIQKSTAPKKKAYIGSLTAINDTNSEIEYKSTLYTFTLDTSTNIVSGKKTLDINDLETDDFVIVLGFLYHDQPDLKAKKVSVINQPEPSQARQLLTGSIEEIDGNKVTIDGKTLIFGTNTNLTIKDIEDPTIEDLELADNLFAIVTLDKNGDIDQVKSVLVVPGKNNPASLEPTNADATESAETENPDEE